MNSIGVTHGRIDRLCEDSARTRLDGRKRFRLDCKQRDRVRSGWTPEYLSAYDKGLAIKPVSGVVSGWFVYAYWSELRGDVSDQRFRWEFESEQAARKWAAGLPKDAQAEVCQRASDRLLDLSGNKRAKVKKGRPGGRHTVKAEAGVDYSGEDFV